MTGRTIFSCNRPKWPVKGKRTKYREESPTAFFAHIIFAAGYESHPQATSNPVPLDAVALRAGFAMGQYGHVCTIK
jgi:hypothetical protein